jgi:glycosyltransferase involved in cell wall biosynthesis
MSPFERTGPTDSLAPPAAFEHDALVVTVYDLIPHLFADRYLRSHVERARYRTRLEVVRRADLVCAISEHTRQDVIRELGVDPARCVNIGGGASSYFDEPGPADDPVGHLRAALPALDRPFVLCVTGWEWRKNTEAVIGAFARLPTSLRRRHQLVLTCAIGAQGIEQWTAAATSAGLAADEVLITGRVDDDVLRALYQTCAVFVFPSLYEGFGLPVLEAARCGAPALTSNVSSLPEILDMPESCFDPGDEEDISRSLERGLTDEAFRSRLRAAGRRAAERQSWEEVASRTVRAYENLAKPCRSRRPRLRVAIVTPLPPSSSGVAVYTGRLVRELPRDWEVTCFYEGERPDPALGLRCFPIRQLGRLYSIREFDAVVFVVGNSIFHPRTIDLATAVGGIVWFHDVNLSEIELFDAGGSGIPEAAAQRMRALLESNYGDRTPTNLPESALLDPETYRRGGLRLSASVAERAEQIIVNSSHAASMLRLELGPERHVPMTVLPHFVPTMADFGIDRLPRRAEAPLVVSLGIVHEVKRPVALLEAVASMRSPAVLRFVGSCRPDLAGLLRARAEELGFDGLELTDELPDPHYAVATAEAWLAVQLRTTTNGESSGAVHDALALGVPVITSIPSARELDSRAVVMVPEDIAPLELGEQIKLLLDDPHGAWEAAGALAGSWTAADVAMGLAAIITDVVRRSGLGLELDAHDSFARMRGEQEAR